jgi:hypothetical protein
VVDDCPACAAPSDVQLNSFTFRELSGRAADPANAFPVAWQIIPCDLRGSGTQARGAAASSCLLSVVVLRRMWQYYHS